MLVKSHRPKACAPVQEGPRSSMAGTPKAQKEWELR